MVAPVGSRRIWLSCPQNARSPTDGSSPPRKPVRGEQGVQIAAQAAQVVEQEGQRLGRRAHRRHRRRDPLREELSRRLDVGARGAAGHVGGDDRPAALGVDLVQPARGEHDADDPFVRVFLQERVEAAPARVPRPQRRLGHVALEASRDRSRVVEGLVGRRDHHRHHRPSGTGTQDLLADLHVLADLEEGQPLQLQEEADLVRVGAERHHVELIRLHHDPPRRWRERKASIAAFERRLASPCQSIWNACGAPSRSSSSLERPLTSRASCRRSE